MQRCVLFAFLGLAACTEAHAPHDAHGPRSASSAAGDAGCTRWEGIYQSLEATGDPVWALAFERNRDALSDDAKSGLDQVMKQVASSTGRVRRFAVVGHADADEAAPRELSEHRAQVAMRALVERGIDPERMEAHGVATAIPSRGGVPGTNRLVTFVTLGDYRRGMRYWADAGFVECPVESTDARCTSTPEFTPRCLEH